VLRECEVTEREKERFLPLMVDPSVLLSADLLKRLKEARYELYLSRTLYKILKERNEEEISNILRYFYWPWQRRLIKIRFELMYQFIEVTKPKPYEAILECRKEIEPYMEKVDLPHEVREILIEEFLFLREKSSLLLRFGRTLNYFKRAGISIINLANTLKDKKEKIFERIKGLKWLVVVLLVATDLPSQDPIFTSLMRGAQFALVVING